VGIAAGNFFSSRLLGGNVLTRSAHSSGCCLLCISATLRFGLIAVDFDGAVVAVDFKRASLSGERHGFSEKYLCVCAHFGVVPRTITLLQRIPWRPPSFRTCGQGVAFDSRQLVVLKAAVVDTDHTLRAVSPSVHDNAPFTKSWDIGARKTLARRTNHQCCTMRQITS
jgi:hypothetical protein